MPNQYTNNPWTDELTRLVERLWMEGKSANQIGKQIGRSRNSVIGKVHRMGLNNVVRQRPTMVVSRFNPRFGPPKPPKPRHKPFRSPSGARLRPSRTMSCPRLSNPSRGRQRAA